MAVSGGGPRPYWNGLGFGAAALAVALFVIFFAPAAPVPPDATLPPAAPTTTGHTITLDELEAMLTDAPGEPPSSVVVETPDGPVTVVVPSTTTSTTSPPTTTTTTTTRPPRPPTPTLPQDVLEDSILDDLFPNGLPPVTLPEGAGGAE